MITQINKIQKFQFLKDFSWTTGVPYFKRYNLIYGWNGSGKTTFSNLFRQLEKKEVEPECEGFEILTSEGKITRENLSSSTLQIKVFNEEFVKENIFTPSGDVSPIVILGKDEISKKDQIESLKSQIQDIEAEKAENRIEQESVKKEIEKLCKFTAKNVKEILRSSGQNKYNNYESPDVRTKCNLLKTTAFQKNILDSLVMEDLTKKLKSDPKASIVPVLFNYPPLPEIIGHVTALLEKTVISQIIDRLQKDNQLNQWVSEGLFLYKKSPNNICPFCEGTVKEDYIKKLEGHYNDEYMAFIKEINSQIDKIVILQKDLQISFPDESRFYEDLTMKYAKIKYDTSVALDELSLFYGQLIETLKEKRMNPFTSVSFNCSIPVWELSDKINQINVLIEEHNTRTHNFSDEINSARLKIEDHYVSEILNEYIEHENQKNILEREIVLKDENITNIQYQITTIEKSFIAHAQAAQKINQDLHDFLNRDEIKLSVKENGYVITRNEEISTKLSEGEKTAISFIYFLNSLKELKFDLSSGIVVIDDPVSSFDSNSLFYAAAFLKERTKDAKQLFILTHNFTFFTEMKNWMNYDGNASQSSKYMLKNVIKDKCRTAKIVELDKLLSSYNSEYHFLFSIVYECAYNRDTDLVSCYPLPNISRKLLESFLAFRIPSSQSLKKKLDSVQFDEKKKRRIYRFTNKNSHDDQISTDIHDDLMYLTETQNILRDILALIQCEDPKHYGAMLAAIQT